MLLAQNVHPYPTGSHLFFSVLVNILQQCLSDVRLQWNAIAWNSKSNKCLTVPLTVAAFPCFHSGQAKATSVQDHSGKCLTEEREILNWWAEYCTELYNHTANGGPSVLDCPQTDTKDDHLILRKEVEAAVQLLKKGKSAGVDNIPAELVQAGGEDVITTLTTICNKIWQTGEWPTPKTQSLVI